MRATLAKGGPRRFIQFYQTLKHNDHDHDGKVSCKEFVKSVQDLRLQIAENDVRAIFSGFDAKNVGFMEIAFFMCTFVPELSEQRLQVVQDLLTALAPKGKPDVVSMTNIKKFYFPRGHPDFLKRKRADYDIKDEFFQTLNTFLGLSGGVHEEIPVDIMLQFFEMMSNAYANADDFCDVLIGSFRMDKICGQNLHGSSIRGDQSVGGSDAYSAKPSGIKHPFGTNQDMPAAKMSRPQTGHQTPQVYNGFGHHDHGEAYGRPQTADRRSPAQADPVKASKNTQGSHEKPQFSREDQTPYRENRDNGRRDMAEDSHRGDFTPARSSHRGDQTPSNYYSPASNDNERRHAAKHTPGSDRKQVQVTPANVRQAVTRQ